MLFSIHLHAQPTEAPVDADYYPPASDEKVRLGQLLFFDKILSGNRNISCATCHHPMAGTGDGLSLPVGEGGRGIGVMRVAPVRTILQRVPRNAPHIFNIGAMEFTAMFADGRIEVDPTQPSGFRTPAGDDLPMGLENVVAAQAMFPVTNPIEMAGQPGENRQGRLVDNLPALWNFIARKLRRNEEYVELFKAAFPDKIFSAGDITFVDAANAIAAFEIAVGRYDNSPFDKFLRGDQSALTDNQKAGMDLFYGDAGCGGFCHSGKFQTNHRYFSIAMPQIGPGVGDGIGGVEDFGRERVTGNEGDRYRFRVPSLRNISVTAPYGHAGAYDTLESVVEHYNDRVGSLMSYDPAEAVLPANRNLDPLDFVAMSNQEILAAIAASTRATELELTDTQKRQLVEFMGALTDPGVYDMRWQVPDSVPSGLPVRD